MPEGQRKIFEAAVDEFVEVLNNTTGGEEEDAHTQALCDAIASSAKAVFSPTTDFKSVHLYGHGAGDDLGVETRVLIGQKNDGSFVTATFWFNPF
ncbi:MAG TPA: hypothetical protein PKY99_08385 [Turneriella sp.]|nr:hypothetical protein [Turneriella sp.]